MNYGDLFYEVCMNVLRLVYVNLLWIAFTLLGLGLFGFFPATAAMFAVIRKWIMKETEIAIFQTFWKHYKSDFMKMNAFGFFFSIIGLFFIYDLSLIKFQEGTLFIFLYYFVLLLFLLFILSLLFFFPIYVQYEFSWKQYIKQSLLMALSSPIESLMIVGGLIIVWFTITFVPSLILLVSGATSAYLIMWITYHRKLEK
ncbi:YesL family protein [Bacillus sp. FSL K6-3431]|uniref:YesL family protein n=1 Tax=Bacillus sp. FSL K6-3431 TaxID=2921500 RepID=UPI0030FB78F0